MAFYMYDPGSRATMQAESISMVSLPGYDRDSAIQALLDAGSEAISRGVVTSNEVVGQLSVADLGRLPVELMSRLLDPDHYDMSVMSKASGLAMYAPTTEGTPNFDLLSEEVEDIEEAIAEERMDRDTYEHLGRRDEITRDALQFEPVVSGPDDRKVIGVRAHDSFGFVALNGLYVPSVTVLSSEHPVRQAIERNRQADQT